MAIREGSKAVYIEKVESAAAILVSMKTGPILPLYRLAAGKALLPLVTEDELKHILITEFDKFTPNTLDGFEALLKSLRNQKTAVSQPTAKNIYL